MYGEGYVNYTLVLYDILAIRLELHLSSGCANDSFSVIFDNRYVSPS
jgi:hypothetical protein